MQLVKICNSLTTLYERGRERERASEREREREILVGSTNKSK